MIDKETVKLQMLNRWEEYFSQLAPDWELKGRGDERVAICPFHEDANPSCSVNVRTGLFHCHACGKGGDGFDIAQRRLGVKFPLILKDVARFAGVMDTNGASAPRVTEEDNNAVLERYISNGVSAGNPLPRPGVTPSPAPVADEPEPSIEPQIVEAYHTQLEGLPDKKAWLLERRGISYATIEEYRIGWDGSRYTIPVLDKDGVCRNIRRYLPDAPQGTEKIMNWKKGYGKRRLFPLDPRVAMTQEEILLCEGEWDCLLARQHGFNAITHTGGVNNWSDEWNSTFAGFDIVICFDSDERKPDEPEHVSKGRENSLKVASKLYGIARSIKIIDLWPGTNEGKDLTDHFLEVGRPKEMLETIIEATPYWEPPPTPAPERPFTPPQDWGVTLTPPTPPESPVEPPRASEGPLEGLPPHTDAANARRFALRHAHRARWVAGIGWHLWDGSRWKPDRGKSVGELAIETAKSIIEEANLVADSGVEGAGDKAKQRFNWAVASLQAPKIANMLTLAQHVPAILIAEPDKLDADIWSLGVRNGTLDLRTGELRASNQAELITKQCPVTYDKDATCPVWDQFVLDIMGGNTEMVRYLQKAIGYSLTGATGEKCFFLLHGIGDNGKTIFLNTIQKLMGLGEYAVVMSFSTLTTKTKSGASEDIAKLRGARYVTAIETNEGQSFNEALLKQITGGEAISARFLHQNSFNFTPLFKLFLATNHKPEVKGTDKGMWTRIRLVPFEQRFSNDPDDLAGGAKPARNKDEFEAELASELSGILNWALAGCAMWQKEGLGTPPEMKKAVQSYRMEQNDVTGFLEARCVVGADYQVESATLFEKYQEWCHDTDREPKSLTGFGRALTAAGFAATRTMKTRYRAGLRLKAEHDGSDESIIGRIDPDDYQGVLGSSVITSHNQSDGTDDEPGF